MTVDGNKKLGHKQQLDVVSSMVIKVDFDLNMSLLAHNILRLFAMDLPGYTHDADYTLYKKFSLYYHTML